MRTLTVGIAAPKPDDGTSYWRAWGPWQRAAQRMRNSETPLHIADLSTISWPQVMGCDVVFMQRPYTMDHVKAIERVLQCGKPVWVDWDDNLLAVREDNPVYKLYAPNLENMEKILRMASVVTVTTETLRKVVFPHNSNVEVLPNAVDFDWWDRVQVPPRKLDGPVHIMWRGGSTHMDALEAVVDDLSEIAENYLDTVWTFLGAVPPPSVKRLMPHDRTRFVEWSHVPECFLRAKALQPDIQFICLQPDVFDMCKSNIGRIEAALCGAVCVCPNWSHWNGIGTFQYDPSESSKAFAKALTTAIDMQPEARQKLAEEALTNVRSEFALDHWNKHRMDILRKIIEKPLKMNVSTGS